MTPRNIENMSAKYSTDSNNTDFTPILTNAVSLLIWLNTSATSFLKTVSPCPPLKSKPFRIGLNPGKSRMFSPS